MISTQGETTSLAQLSFCYLSLICVLNFQLCPPDHLTPKQGAKNNRRKQNQNKYIQSSSATFHQRVTVYSWAARAINCLGNFSFLSIILIFSSIYLKLKFPAKLKIDDGQDKLNLCCGSKGLRWKKPWNPKLPRCARVTSLLCQSPIIFIHSGTIVPNINCHCQDNK